MSGARLDRLAEVAEVLRARDLAKLGKLAQARNQSAARIAALSARVEMTEDPALNAARLAHAQWAKEQRIRLNQTLARQSAAVLEHKAQAARSHGRALALEKLRKVAR
jgi:hypothetical protein